MRVIVVGATGHIGSYLVPRLVARGYDVVAISRGRRLPYKSDRAWRQVERLSLDREIEERDGTFGERIVSYGADAVLDLVCFTPSSAEQLVSALRGTSTYLIHCGTTWVHGPGVEVPVSEDAPRHPFGLYGAAKAAIERLLLAEARDQHFPACVLHPGHIVGPGWVPVTPSGNFDVGIFGSLSRGEEVALPNLGLETLHHVHADDVAQAFVLALENEPIAVGEAFHVVSPRALTMRGYAEAVASWFSEEARLRFLPWEDWRQTVEEADAETTMDHLAHSSCISIEKARHVLGYSPGYSSLEAIYDAVSWLVADGQIETHGRRLRDASALS